MAALYIPPSHKILKPIKEGKYKKGTKEKTVFKKDEIFYRRGTQSIRNPSKIELELLNKRLEKENYRLSVLSGDPDEIEETIYSNLFPVTALPKYVYLGNQREYDDVSIKVLLKQEGVFPNFFHKFKQWNDKIVTFENLDNEQNTYRKLVHTDTIRRESIEGWIQDPDKNRIIVELLNRELKHYAMNKGMFHFREKNRLYYPLETPESKKTTKKWRARYGTAERAVAARMYAEQLNRFIYCHTAFYPSFVEIGPGKFYLRILPTFVLTDDGRNPTYGFKEGTVITRLSYDRYNDKYLNTILFWIHQLGDGKDIKIGDYLVIDSKPVEAQVTVGIVFDIPSSEFRLQITEDETTKEDGNDGL